MVSLVKDMVGLSDERKGSRHVRGKLSTRVRTREKREAGAGACGPCGPPLFTPPPPPLCMYDTVYRIPPNVLFSYLLRDAGVGVWSRWFRVHAHLPCPRDESPRLPHKRATLVVVRQHVRRPRHRKRRNKHPLFFRHFATDMMTRRMTPRPASIFPSPPTSFAPPRALADPHPHPHPRSPPR